MRPCGRGLSFGVVFLPLFAFTIASAEAQTQRYCRSNPIRAAFESIFVARSVVQAVADPIMEPLAAAVTAPLHRATDAPMRGELVQEEEMGLEEAPRAIRVAYVAPRASAAVPPRHRWGDAEDEPPYFDSEEEPHPAGM